jgi:hypothetical protein
MGRVADQPGLLLRPRGAVDIAADFAPLWIADRGQRWRLAAYRKARPGL